MPEQYLTAKQIWESRGISNNTFYRLVRDGLIPPGERVGIRSVRWKESVIEAAFAAMNKERSAA